MLMQVERGGGGRGIATTHSQRGTRRRWVAVPCFGHFILLQDRVWVARKISFPPKFDPRTVQPLASRYTDYTIPTAAPNHIRPLHHPLSSVFNIILSTILKHPVGTAQPEALQILCEQRLCMLRSFRGKYCVVLAMSTCLKWRHSSTSALDGRDSLAREDSFGTQWAD